MIPSGLFLADTSALARVAHASVREELTRLGKQDLIASCVTVDLEVLYSARSPAEYAEIAQLRAETFVDPPITHAC